MAAAAEVEILIEETDAALVETASTTAATMDVALSEAVVETEWTGLTLDMGAAATTEMFTEMSTEVLPEVLSWSKLQSGSIDMIDEAHTVMGWPMGETDMTMPMGELSADISGIQNDTEAAQLEQKAGSGGGFKLLGKILLYGTGAIMTLDWIAGKLAALIESEIHAADVPSWAKNMTPEQKADLKAITAALPKLSIIIQSWNDQFQTYHTNYVDMGTVDTKIGSLIQTVPVMYILFYAMSDMKAVSYLIN